MRAWEPPTALAGWTHPEPDLGRRTPPGARAKGPAPGRALPATPRGERAAARRRRRRPGRLPDALLPAPATVPSPHVLRAGLRLPALRPHRLLAMNPFLGKRHAGEEEEGQGG